jgi:hypothetical protein
MVPGLMPWHMARLTRPELQALEQQYRSWSAEEA